MKKQLVINGNTFGSVMHYQQDRETDTWEFTLNNAVQISIPFSEIKLFTSAENLEIITRKGF